MKLNKLSTIATATLLAMGVTAAAAASDRVIIQVDNSKKGVVKALAKQLGGEIKVDADGFIAAQFSGKSLSEIKGLLNNPHIKLVEADVQRHAMALFNDDAGNPATQQLTPYAVYQSQANQVGLNLGNTKKVCVIDSGIARDTGETGGGNNDFDWSNITGTSNSGTGDWFRDGGPHGTHVAGTIAAADNGIGVIGMAPGNPMHIIKVFNDAGWGYSSDLAFAAQKCTEAGAKIISMSLGGGGANSTEENAFNTFTNNGGLVLAAAGNDGNTTRSYPAGYASVMMIGANDANNNIASFSQYPSCTVTSGRGKNATTTTNDGFCVEASAGGVDTLSTYPAGGTSMVTAVADGVGFAAAPSDNTGSLNNATYHMGTAQTTDAGANGKICTIDRGVVSFADKINNCANSGGIGAIVINNVAGEGPVYMDVTGAANIPSYGAALESRSNLVGATNITISSSASDYGYMSGTSMATPAVSGIAALVWSNFPSCSGTEIRNALKATAQDAGAAGKDVYFGYGIVKAKAAYDYLTANGCTGSGTGGGGGGGTDPEPEPCKGGPRKCG
ncbi:MAG: peptidase S8 [Rheinheimera sp.]|uniref:S8 family serine peptidase n=1 Tax=Arsukibacterium sp. UBA3155 TaxID=1946058 RepID=UPI000C88F543|nr:S8 family serine peptidase [Arsukibacterium sp. UBA3155]MAD75364.1 peptidase S8 [Rheinheimera sp.]|tara:strand:- start:184942 stop:186618 length:1677 start_codon:yes stop_codon:yes gene_type:complete